MWAEKRMTVINNAFQEALSLCRNPSSGLAASTPEREQLADAKKLMELGQLSAARQALLRVATRSAEWNYLFGALLLRLGEYEKAVLYFGIASRQRPGNSQYRSAYHNAEAIRNQRRGEDFIGRLMRPFAGKKG
jgi:tetratricopeptide (TPR) repeat protein